MAHKITDEFLDKLATSRVYPLDRGYIIVGDDLVAVIRELQERRKADSRANVRREHAEWADTTFGNIGPVGPLKHLSQEALEAAAAPGDLSEWADMQFLLWDAQRRAGYTDEQITQAMIEKLAINKQRQWPEPKDGEPRLHIKEQPTAMKDHQIRELVNELRDIAIKYHNTQQLREHLARAVRTAITAGGGVL